MKRYTDAADSSDSLLHAKPPPTAPLPNKLATNFPSQLSNHDQDDPTHPVPIYLRTASKASYKVQLPAKISIAEIKAEVQAQTGLPRDRQLLYLNGKNITEYGCIQLQAHNILHVLSSDQVCSQADQLEVKLTVIDFLTEPRSKIRKEYQISGAELVGDFITKVEQELRKQMSLVKTGVQLHLLESSRLLDKEKTFAEQDVTRHADVVCMITEHQLKTRFSNDTKEEILHDISELMGFGDTSAAKKVDKQEKTTRLRYPRAPNPYDSPQPKKTQEKVQQASQNDDSNGIAASKSPISQDTKPNFKKKSNVLVKALSFEASSSDQPQLATKIRASKSKKQIEELLRSQQKSQEFFESPQVIKEEAKEGIPESQQKEGKLEMHKPAPLVLKSMPVDERRRIRLEMEKLFDLGDSPPPAEEESKEQKEEERPTSPPTIENRKPVQRERDQDRLRLSLGSRPAFLAQLRLPPPKPSP